RNCHLLAVFAPPTRRNSAEGNLLSRRLLRANAASNQSRHLPLPRRMVRLSRLKANRHVSSGVPLAQSERKRRSLERLAESDGRPRPRAQAQVTSNQDCYCGRGPAFFWASATKGAWGRGIQGLRGLGERTREISQAWRPSKTLLGSSSGGGTGTSSGRSARIRGEFLHRGVKSRKWLSV